MLFEIGGVNKGLLYLTDFPQSRLIYKKVWGTYVKDNFTYSQYLSVIATVFLYTGTHVLLLKGQGIVWSSYS